MVSHPEAPGSFERLATSLGLEERGEAFAGNVRGQQLVLTWYQEPTKKRPRRPESIHLGFERELDLGLNVSRKPVDSLLGTLEESSFGESVKIEADEPARLKSLMTPELVSGWQLLETLIPRSVGWGVTDSSLYLSDGAGALPDPHLRQVIDSAIDSTLLLVDQCSRIPVPGPLERHADIWGAFARAQGLTLERGPLRMHGRLEHFEVLARVMRTDVLEYRSELTVAFPRNLLLGLMIEPQSSVEVPGEWNDRALGDEAFDAAFRLGAHDPKTARSLFDRQARQLLIELASQVANFEITDERVALWPSFALEPPGTIPQLALQAAELAMLILRGADGRPPTNTYR